MINPVCLLNNHPSSKTRFLRYFKSKLVIQTRNIFFASFIQVCNYPQQMVYTFRLRASEILWKWVVEQTFDETYILYSTRTTKNFYLCYFLTIRSLLYSVYLPPTLRLRTRQQLFQRQRFLHRFFGRIPLVESIYFLNFYHIFGFLFYFKQYEMQNILFFYNL